MQRSDVWLINLDPTIGSEIRKTRPAIIVSDDQVGILPLRVIVPLTDWKDRYQIAVWMVKLSPTTANGLSKTSAADAFQVRSVSQRRFVRKLGRVDDDTMTAIEKALAVVLSIR
ncbi:MAG: type II toxin-antitoxin system PemK/MazF family toxin [Anaerolineae bacterium]